MTEYIKMKMRIKSLLLFLYLKTLGRVFTYIIARKHPNNVDIQFARYMGKKAKRNMFDNSKTIKLYKRYFTNGLTIWMN